MPSNPLARAIAAMAGGGAGAQLLALLAAPLLTRIYDPGSYGILAFYTAVVSILAIVSTLRFHMAIPLASTEDEEGDLGALCLILIGTITVVTTATLLYLVGAGIVTSTNTDLWHFLGLIPLGVTAIGCYQLVSYVAVRRKEFTEIAKTKLFQVIGMLAIQFSAAPLGALGLIAGQIFGNSAGIRRLTMRTWGERGGATVRTRGIWTVITKYKRFPLISVWAALANTISARAPLLVLFVAFGPAMAGLYMLAYRVLTLPATVLTQAIGNTFFSHAATEAKGGRGVVNLFRELVVLLSNLAAIPLLFLVIWGRELFGVMFGQEWAMAGQIGGWIAPWVFLMFITSPLSTIFYVVGKQGHELVIQLALLIGRLIGLILGVYLESLEVAIILYSLASFLGYSFHLILETRVACAPYGDIAGVVLMAILRAAICLVPVFVVIEYGGGPFQILMVSALCLVFALIVYRSCVLNVYARLGLERN